ncbi:hypothetical protein ACLB1O_10970 [Escherichia coli]
MGLNALFSTPDHIWVTDGGLTWAATVLPVVIMYALSERFIKSGLTAGWREGLKRPVSFNKEF